MAGYKWNGTQPPTENELKWRNPDLKARHKEALRRVIDEMTPEERQKRFGNRGVKHCTLCHEPGHYQDRCPTLVIVRVIPLRKKEGE